MKLDEAIQLLKIGKHYRNVSLEAADKLPKKLIEFGYSWLNLPNQSLYLFGHVGSGKTYFSICLLRELIKKGKNCLFINSLQLDKELLAGSRGQGQFNEDHVIRRYSDCDYLFLDDLGVESDTPRVERQYYEIINSRIVNEKVTIITTNFDLEEISLKLGKRIASRLSGHYFIKFPDKDLRVYRTEK